MTPEQRRRAIEVAAEGLHKDDHGCPDPQTHVHSRCDSYYGEAGASAVQALIDAGMLCSHDLDANDQAKVVAHFAQKFIYDAGFGVPEARDELQRSALRNLRAALSGSAPTRTDQPKRVMGAVRSDAADERLRNTMEKIREAERAVSSIHTIKLGTVEES